MNSANSNATWPTPSAGNKLVIEIRGLIPGKKNSKMILPAKGKRRTMLITKPEFQDRIKEIEAAIESQLNSAFQTGAGATFPTPSKRSWIALSLFEDDCWEIVPSLTLSGKLDAQNVGATITIERIE